MKRSALSFPFRVKRDLFFRAFIFSTLLIPFNAMAQVRTITVDTKKTGSSISNTMYGIFFEDINFGADGGLYAELIKNRSFEFDHSMVGWLPFGTVSICTENPAFDKNPHYARLTHSNELTGTGLENEGFRGMGLKAGEKYIFSAYIRCQDVQKYNIKIELLDAANEIIGSKEMEISGPSWKKYETEITSGKTENKASFRLTLISKTTVDIDHISLFPVNTYKNRRNGLRSDLAQALEDLHPAIFRFPGGCIVEGSNLATRYQWKNTVGAVENRPININRWNYTFAHKKFSDYYQSYGLGFFEYFQLSEDIGAEPLPVLNCGLSCQFENHDPNQNCAVENLGAYIQDAIDLIEFANGANNTKWGKLRAEMGHPAPFNLKYIAIGNEQWGSLYPERLAPFVNALRKSHPEIQIIGTVGPSPDGKDFDYGWAEMRKLKVDLADEHYYKSPDWFLKNANRYDNYPRTGTKVFAGEYACHVNSRKNTLESALCEAAFMTGFERNADVVRMCTYAPLFAHVEAFQWLPDLIWFDNLRSVKTPNYYVQKMFAHYPGTNVLSTTCDKLPLTGQNGLYASSVIDKISNQLIIKIVNTTSSVQPVHYVFAGLKPSTRSAHRIVLGNSNTDAVNSLDMPENIVPIENDITIDGNSFDLPMQANSFYLIAIKI